MKLSTRIKNNVATGNGLSSLLVVLMVDCRRTGFETYSLDMADEYHRHLTKDEHCTLLPQETVINGNGKIIFHYTSTTYGDWINR